MSAPRVRVRVLGVGLGPQHVTAEVAQALTEVDYVVALRKSEDDPLLEARRALCRRFGDRPLVEVTDPERDRRPRDGAAYDRAVEEWHAARARVLEEALSARGGTAGLLVWGDPSLYDSTLRLLDRVRERGAVDVEHDVLPGISAPQVLAARHRVVLHEVGRSVHVTTERRLVEAVDLGLDNLVVMLTRDLDRVLADERLETWRLWWGANLGAAGEQLVAGRVADVRDRLAGARRRARAADGWVMDVALLRRSS